jgi:hypothetical protein
MVGSNAGGVGGKLDVGTRPDAVSRARELRLL